MALRAGLAAARDRFVEDGSVTPVAGEQARDGGLEGAVLGHAGQSHRKPVQAEANPTVEQGLGRRGHRHHLPLTVEQDGHLGGVDQPRQHLLAAFLAQRHLHPHRPVRLTGDAREGGKGVGRAAPVTARPQQGKPDEPVLVEHQRGLASERQVEIAHRIVVEGGPATITIGVVMALVLDGPGAPHRTIDPPIILAVHGRIDEVPVRVVTVLAEIVESQGKAGSAATQLRHFAAGGEGHLPQGVEPAIIVEGRIEKGDFRITNTLVD